MSKEKGKKWKKDKRISIISLISNLLSSDNGSVRVLELFVDPKTMKNKANIVSSGYIITTLESFLILLSSAFL